MSDGTNDTWRVWHDLQRKEEALDGTAGSLVMVVGGWGFEQLGRVNRVRKALDDSGPIARRLIAERLAGIDLSAIWPILIAACQDIALYYGGSVVLGGVIGGVGGALFGGVGAVPGAAAGAAAGSYVGGAVLALLGLKSLVEGLAQSIPEALRCYQDGFLKAWGPVRREREPGLDGFGHGDPAFAAYDLANGHVIMISLVLTGMIAYLTRGRGDRAVLLNEISRSPRLGPRVAKWVEENWEKLRGHPALQSRRHGTLPGNEPGPAPKKGRTSTQEKQGQRPAGMPQKKVPCFTTKDLPKKSEDEFDRQLLGQQRGINDMTVDEYLKGRKAFDDGIAVRDPSIGRDARALYRDNLETELKEKYQLEGFSPRRAERKAVVAAAKTMKTLAALHNPDMVAGGKDVISDFGSRNVNSRIGAQWKTGERLMQLDKAARAIPASLRRTTMMNAKLERCK
jgi:hypothetical protein